MKRTLVLIVAAACIPGAIDLTGKTCSSDDDCGGTLACKAGFCGGPGDAGAPDSGAPDSGAPDSGAPDAGTPDSGTPDSGVQCLPGPPHPNLTFDPTMDPVDSGVFGDDAGNAWQMIIAGGVGGTASIELVDAGPCHETALHLERMTANMDGGNALALDPGSGHWLDGSQTGTLCTSVDVMRPDGGTTENMKLEFTFFKPDGGVHPSVLLPVATEWVRLSFGTATPTDLWTSGFASVSGDAAKGNPFVVDNFYVWQSVDGGCD